MNKLQRLSRILSYADELRLDQEHVRDFDYNVTARNRSSYVKFIGMAESISAGVLTVSHHENLTVSITAGSVLTEL
jgi:hypothetical protein